MTARILDGAAIAKEIREEIAREVAVLAGQGIVPGLAVVIVGDDPASQIYVKSKGQACHEVGMLSHRCGDPEVDALWIDSTLEIGDREPGTWAEVRAVVDGETIATESRVLADSATLQSSLFVTDPDEYTGRDVCVEVRIMDASGNASEPTSECTAIEAASSGCAITGRPHALALLLLVFLWRPRAA